MLSMHGRGWRRFFREECGATLVEYGIAITLAVFVGTTALVLLGGSIEGVMGAAANCMDNAPTGAC